MAADHYQVLGVDRDASFDEIKKVYRRLAREYHPDVNPDPHAQEKFKEITTAYEVLSDPEKRQRYDLGGDGFSGGFNGNFGFSDIMDAFFGGGTTNRGPRPRSRAGQDALIRIEITLNESCFGLEKTTKVETAGVCTHCQATGSESKSKPKLCGICKGRGEIQQVTRSIIGQVMTSRPCGSCSGFGTVIADPCHECAGDGRVRTAKEININIPAGIATGNRIHLAGQGEIGPGGGPAGDLYVEIMVTPHPLFERVDDNLHCAITIPFSIAILGGSFEIETLDGLKTIEIKPGSEHGQEIRLPGLGMTRLRSSGRGDLIVHTLVTSPKKISEEQRNLISEFAKLRKEDNSSIKVHHLKDEIDQETGFFQRHFGKNR